MKWAKTLLLYFGVSALLLVLGFFVWPIVFAQNQEIQPQQCAKNEDCSSGTFCQNGICNALPPIWNNKQAPSTIQVASFNIQGPGIISSFSGDNAEIKLKSSSTLDHWGIYQERSNGELRFWNGDNRLFLSTKGDITSTGCFGPKFVGLTTRLYDGNNGGYVKAHQACDSQFKGSHVCSTAEILESIKCGTSTDPIFKMNKEFAWILNGPPAYLAPANDCLGRTSNSTSSYGAIWIFDSNGGKGYLTSCNTQQQFACCK